ncbi:MAG TPA: FtsX-like permease family protein [Kofleriaceae bacterium]|nr:FtsX-like permease family protein [Kofleriaceae bacterium]
MSESLRRSPPRVRLLVYFARKSLFSSKLTVVLLAIAIAAGAGFQIANSANLAGFSDALLEEGLTRGTGDIRVEPRDKPRFTDGDAVAAKLAAISGGRAVPVLVYAGAVGVRGKFLGTPVFGLDPDERPYHIVDGGPLARGDTQGILIGSSLAKRLGVKPGDAIDVRVIIAAPDPLLGLDNTATYTLTVRGVVSGSAGGYRTAFLDRGFLGKEAGAPKGASAIVVRLDDHFSAGDVAARIEAAMPEVQAIGWREDDPYLKNYLRANATINSVSYAMVIAAVSLPILALLYIHVLKRRREIAILAALGFGRLEVFVIYVLQGIVVAIIGCVVGAAAGYGLIRYFQANPLFEWESLIVRPLVVPRTFIVPALVIIGTAAAAASYPAWRAARTDPARILRRIE